MVGICRTMSGCTSKEKDFYKIECIENGKSDIFFIEQMSICADGAVDEDEEIYDEEIWEESIDDFLNCGGAYDVEVEHIGDHYCLFFKLFTITLYDEYLLPKVAGAFVSWANHYNLPFTEESIEDFCKEYGFEEDIDTIKYWVVGEEN